VNPGRCAIERRLQERRRARQNVVEGAGQHAAILNAGMAADDFAAGGGIDDGHDRSPRPDQSGDGGGFLAAAVEVQVPSPFTRARVAAAEIDDEVRAAGVARHKQRKIRSCSGGEWASPRQAVEPTLDRRHHGRGARQRRGFLAPCDGNPRQRPLRQAPDQRQVPLP